MLPPLTNSEVSLLFVNVVSLALSTVPPVLLLAYGWQSMAMRNMRPEFSLRPSEVAELDRALLLYARVRRQLSHLDDQEPLGLWRALFVHRSDADGGSTDEREDLKAHARYLRATIVRLRGLPLERMRAWIHVASKRYALGNALFVHVETFVMVIAAFYFYGQSAWIQKLMADAADPLIWYPFDERVFHANAAAAAVATLLGPLFYLLRRSRLRDEHGLEFHVLTALAEAEPEQKIRQPQGDLADDDIWAGGNSAGMSRDEPWFAVLGVAESASIEQTTEAYKVLLKQSHPDRVHGMSPAIRNVAEEETKRLNAAYQQARASLS